jgi:hypothetical protein
MPYLLALIAFSSRPTEVQKMSTFMDHINCNGFIGLCEDLSELFLDFSGWPRRRLNQFHCFFILSIKKTVLIEAREGRALKGLFSSYFIPSYLGC